VTTTAFRAISLPSRMIAMLVLCAVACTSSLALAADARKLQRVSAQDWKAIQDVVARQMNAFRLDDERVAFSLASPGIQSVFESPSQFMEMVRSDYRAVYRPRAYRFLKPAIVQGEPVQPVEVVALDGAVSIAAFSLERQRDRTWRISGCTLIESRQFAT